MSTDKIDIPNILVQPAGFTEPIRFADLIQKIVMGEQRVADSIRVLWAQRPEATHVEGMHLFVRALILSSGAGVRRPLHYLRRVNKWYRDVKRAQRKALVSGIPFYTLQDFVGEGLARFIMGLIDAEQTVAQADIPFSDRPWWLHIDGERRCYKSLKALMQAHRDLPSKHFHTFSHAKHPDVQAMGARAVNMKQGIHSSLNNFLREAVMRGWVK